MFQWLADLNDSVNTFVWITIGVWLLVGSGVIMTVLTGFFQVSHFGHWIKKTIGSVFKKRVIAHTGEKGTISQFQALCTALSATVGTGNIAGVAAAITMGGPGAIFWMWVAAFFGMMTNYSENVLGIFFRRRNSKGEWSGGAMYYLRDGLGAKKGMKTVGAVLAILFSCFAVLASFGIGNISQVNTIVLNIESSFAIPSLSSIVLYNNVNLYKIIIAAVVLILSALVIVGGLKRIASVAEKIVPFMIICFLIGAIVVIIKNVGNLGVAFAAIFRSAFSAKAAWGAVTGLTIKTMVVWGFKRGCFSNEAGLGSSVMVHSNSNVKEPVHQGLWGIFEVFVDTIVICTLVALVILTSGVIDLETGAIVQGGGEGATLVATAFSTVFGSFGAKFVAVALFLFAFTTVLGWSHYGTKSIEYLGGEKAASVYKVIFVVIIITGSLLTSSLAWDISDTFNGLMMIPNLIGVLVLSPIVVRLTRNYVRREIHSEKIEPMLSAFPDIQAEQAARTDED
ncbi:MAG: alanine:cation symporter family protein [Oscillospiraceae bacterium]|nr:alanine:cation symporter family protein [Oscillospiraceae bacterium]